MSSDAPFLSIDVGNTSVVIGLFAGTNLEQSWRLSSFWGRTGDEISLILRELTGEALLIATGEDLATANGCVGCHSSDGIDIIGQPG